MTPARVVSVPSAPVEAAPPEDNLGTMTSPRVGVLWNGVPLEELGLAEHLLSVEFTTTVGRTKATTRSPTGKPKVGGATITFHLADQGAARMLTALLLANKQPVLTVGFGYWDSAAWWVGEVQAAKKPDQKLFGDVHGFKMDNVSFSYGDGVPKLVINGMVDRALALVERKGPRVHEGKTAYQLLKEMTDEHGIVLRVDGDLPADQRLSHVVQTNTDSTLDLVTQVAGRIGGYPLFRSAGAAELGAADPYSYQVRSDSGAALPDPAAVRDQVRTILHVISLQRFLDLSRYEAARPVVIGYGPGCDNGRRPQCDYLASKVGVSVSHFSRPSMAAGATKPTGAASATGATPESSDFDYLFRDTVDGTLLTDTINLVDNVASGAFLRAIGRSEEDATSGLPPGPWRDLSPIAPPPAPAKPTVVVRPHPVDLDSAQRLGSAQLQAAAVLAQQCIRISIELFPGPPALQPLTPVRLVGTTAHDGLYVVEETRISYNNSGLRVGLSLAPLARGGKGSGSGAASGAKTSGNASGVTPDLSDGDYLYRDMVDGSLQTMNLHLSDGVLKTEENGALGRMFGVDPKVTTEKLTDTPTAPDGEDDVPDDGGGK